MADFRAAGSSALRRGWSKIDVYIWILLLPALLVTVGMWERARNTDTLQLYGGAAQILPGTLEQLRKIEARGPMEMIEQVRGDERRSIPVSLAVAETERAIPMAERGAFLARLRAPMPVVAIAGGLLAFLAGGAGLVIAARAGINARQSRNQLIASFSRVHHLLPFLLGGVVTGLAFAILAIVGFEIVGMWFWSRLSGGEIKLMAIAAVLAFLAGYGAFSALRGMRDIFTLNTPEPMEENGHVVSEADAPGLWRFVRDLAERQKALVPDAIVVGMDGGFYVTEHAMKLTPGEQLLTGRTLYLPAPYLEMMDEEELAGVIGHELAHFVGDDTAYSRNFTPIYMGLERALEVMGEATAKGFAMYPAFRLGFHTIEQFDHAVKHWGRLREFEADRLSSLASGPRSIAQSLVRTSVIAPVVTATLERAFAEPARADRDLITDMVGMVREHGWPDVAEHLEDHAAHPTDTHPSTPQRIEALNLRLQDGLIAAATRPPVGEAPTPGERLFADWLATRRMLSGDFNAAAQSAHAAHRANLENAVSAIAQEDVPLYENSGPLIWVLAVIGTALGLGALAFIAMIAGTPLKEASAIATFAGILGVIAAIMLWAAFRLNRARRQPAFIFNPDGIRMRRLPQPLRWLDIDAFRVAAGYRVEAIFLISEDAQMPAGSGFPSRVRVKPKKRTVTVFFQGVRGMRPTEFSDMIDRYINAAHARHILAERYSGAEALSPAAA